MSNIETIQRMLKEIEILSNNNLLLRAENNELERSFIKLRDAFVELLDVHKELRERSGIDYVDFEYDWMEKSGLMDLNQ